MDNFNWTSFTRKIAIKATLVELYNAWTIPQEIEKWFLRKVPFKKPNEETVNSSEHKKQNDTYEWS